MLNRKDFYHQNIRYSFHYHKERLNKLNSINEEYRKLEYYFKNVFEGNIPNELFNMKQNPRISRFKMKGIKKAFLNSYSKKLIRKGLIREFDSTNKLSYYANQVYKNFKNNRINKKPGHEPILKNILIRDEESIAIEIPIWRRVNNSYITGHIDLIQVNHEKIKIIDYKPEGEFLYSLPQVASYGLIFKSNFHFDNIKCVSFNKNNAWEYNPDILLNEIKKYFNHHRKNINEWEKFLV